MLQVGDFLPQNKRELSGVRVVIFAFFFKRSKDLNLGRIYFVAFNNTYLKLIIYLNKGRDISIEYIELGVSRWLRLIIYTS